MAEANGESSLIMGLDIGTTSIKVALIQSSDGQTALFKSRDTGAHVKQFEDPELTTCTNEQDVHKILHALHVLVSGLSRELLSRVRRIAVCGQMHGVVLWKQGSGWDKTEHGRFEPRDCSRLITWQDGRCSPTFLSQLPAPNSHLRLATGYGCPTIFWLQQNKSEWLTQYNRAGTIQDMVVSMLCGLNCCKMTVQNAASWGYMNAAQCQWNVEILSSAGFPVNLLPEIMQPGEIAGNLVDGWCGVPAGTDVLAALGDLQCSVRAVDRRTGEAVLNVSTSAQLGVVLPATQDRAPPLHLLPQEVATFVELVPYFSPGEYLAVAAALTGGNAMAAFVKLLQQWSHELGLGIPKKDIWSKLAVLGEQADDTDLSISPCIFGERHDPARRAAVKNVTVLNLGLGEVYRALCRGVVNNLVEMFPPHVLSQLNVHGIVGSGTAVLQNKVLQECLLQRYAPLIIRYAAGAEAAVGAARSACETI